MLENWINWAYFASGEAFFTKNTMKVSFLARDQARVNFFV
jgi:hypothetical protein